MKDQEKKKKKKTTKNNFIRIYGIRKKNTGSMIIEIRIQVSCSSFDGAVPCC